MAVLPTLPRILTSALDWKRWLRSAKAGRAPAILTRRHLYILPSRYGILYAVILLAMLTGAINYTLSLGFVVTFLLAGLGIVAMLHTWRNLIGLQVQAKPCAPVFAGDDALFEVTIMEAQRRARHAIAAHFDRQAAGSADLLYADLDAGGSSLYRLSLATQQRGWLMAPRLKVFTEYPLALFHAWSYVTLDSRCLVYPRPLAGGEPPPELASAQSTAGRDAHSGDEDFAGLRHYQYGDSPRRVDWKASSREQGLYTKQFQGEASTLLWLDWHATPGADTEQRISQLARWVVDAHQAKRRFGLRLPGQEFAPDQGEQHYHTCMQALALLEPRP